MHIAYCVKVQKNYTVLGLQQVILLVPFQLHFRYKSCLIHCMRISLICLQHVELCERSQHKTCLVGATAIIITVLACTKVYVQLVHEAPRNTIGQPSMQLLLPGLKAQMQFVCLLVCPAPTPCPAPAPDMCLLSYR